MHATMTASDRAVVLIRRGEVRDRFARRRLFAGILQVKIRQEVSRIRTLLPSFYARESGVMLVVRPMAHAASSAPPPAPLPPSVSEWGSVAPQEDVGRLKGSESKGYAWRC